ncbi:MAG: hypothetical protein RLY95_1561 [Pseudomonadota bacterium]|jgi:hypothetical protein
MAYTHGEQLFIDARGGTVPNESEWLEIKALLAAMEKANFPIDEPTSAPFISIMAFFYARAPKPVDSAILVTEIMRTFTGAQTTLLADLRVMLESKQNPVIHLDVIETFKESLRASVKEVITLTSIFIVTIAVGLSGFFGWQVHAWKSQFSGASMQLSTPK